MEKPYSFLLRNLCETDEDTFRIVEFEKRRQERKLIMIASESMCPKAVLEAQASVFSHLYAEGYPPLKMAVKEGEKILDFESQMLALKTEGDLRYYKGCDYANFIEALAQWRAAQIFAHKDGTVDIKPQDIFVNVQALSGAAANNAVYHALLEPGQIIMGLTLSHGGHLSHGSKVNRSGKLYKPLMYKVDLATGKLDYAQIHQLALQNKPKIIVAGASAYPFDIDWKRMRQIADEVGAFLLADISHPSGLVVAGLFSNPLGYAHATTTTTHKTLCGPRAAIILTTDKEIAAKIDKAIFPGEQGGPHINTIAGLAVAFKLAGTAEFRNLMQRIVQNSVALCDSLTKRGLKIAGGGTSTHLCLVDLKSVTTASGVPLRGEVAATILDLCGLTCNRNTIPGDTASAEASAIRLGTTWLTQLGFGPVEMDRVAALIHDVLTNIQTYAVESKAGTTIRGKLPFAVMQRAKREVAALLRHDEHPEYPQYPHYYTPAIKPVPRHSLASNRKETVVAERSGIMLAMQLDKAEVEAKNAKDKSVLVHTVENGLLEIVGTKAVSFVSDLVTANVVTLEEGHGVHSLMFDLEGRYFDDVHIWRMSNDDKTGLPRLWLIANPHAREQVKEWLRALSDGYVMCDKDPQTSVATPVYVRDLFEQLPAMTSLTVIGPKATEVIASLATGTKELEPWTIRKVIWQQHTIYVARVGFGKSQPVYDLYLPQESVPEVANKLQELSHGNLTLAGYGVLDSLRQEAGLPITTQAAYDITATTWYQKFGGYFFPGKPYFVGQAAFKMCYAQTTKGRHVYQLYQGEPRYTCLAQEHAKLTKRVLTPFAGWWMPILYTSILEEHKYVRETAGLFDVTHMGVVEVSGKGATRFLDLISPNEVEKLNIGQSLYSFLLTPEGTVIDDMTVYRRDKEKYMLVINASNAEKDLAWIMAIASRQVVIDNDFPDMTVDAVPEIRYLKALEAGQDRKVDVALQGPKSLEILQKLAGNDENLKKQLAGLRKWYFVETTLCGMPMIICRSGYTGESWGFEIYLHPDHAPSLWNHLLETGKAFGIQPTGLGARDSTRTEAGFPLYGHELGSEREITPQEAGYSNFLRYDKPFFIGKTALQARDHASNVRIVRFEMEQTGIRAVRPGALVFNPQGQVIGNVTSCAFVGPKQVGLAYVDKQYTTTGTKLGILNLPASKKVKTLNELQRGDTIPVPDLAIVATRFAMRS